MIEKARTMNPGFKHFFFAVLAPCLQLAHAASLPDYKCTIETVVGGASGPVEVLEYERKVKVGRDFTVDRQSGKMIGALKNSFATEPVIIDSGIKGNSYKVITTMTTKQGLGHGSSIFALVINEYDDRPAKPFVYLSGDMVYLGRCVYFQ